MRLAKLAGLWLLLSSGYGSHTALAEATSLRAAKQYGLGYLQMMIMEDMKLVEKHARAAGLGDIEVTWNTFRSSDVMNDALLSGNVDFVSLGITGMVTIWDRTKGTIDVRGATGFNAMPISLNVRNPNVKSLKDFTEQDRIAMPAVGISNQAVLLRMACEKEFGAGQHAKLDHIAITMSHPDATIAMLAGQKDVTANFSSVPFQYRQQKQAGIRELMTSTDILGGAFSFNVLATTAKFRTDNPKLYASFLAAVKEATDMVNKDRKWAAETYLRISKDKMALEELMEIINRPDIEFTTKLKGVDPMIKFMSRTNNLKNKPESIKEVVFPEAEM